MDNPQHSLDDALVEKASEAIYDFLHECFPDGALPGGKQLFADIWEQAKEVGARDAGVAGRKRPTVRLGWQAVNRELRLGRTTVANARYREEATMADPLDSVKSQVDLMRAMARRAEQAERAEDATIYTDRADSLEAVIAELEKLRRITQPIPATYGDLSDLPPSLLKELSGLKADDREQQLYTIIRSADGDEVELDTILIELWRRFKVEETRKFLQNKLWRMAQKRMIFTVTGKKGVYSAMEQPKPVRRPPPAAFDTDLDDDVPF